MLDLSGLSAWEIHFKSWIQVEVIGMRSGAVLSFSRDENRTATMIAGNKVILDGEEMSLSAAALKLLRELGCKTLAAQGPAY
jgi:hypothetical protein